MRPCTKRPRRPASTCVFEKRSLRLLHGVAKGLSRLEGRRLRCGDGNAFTRARVAALARRPSSCRERAEPRYLHRLPVGQRLANSREQRIYNPVRVGPRQQGLGCSFERNSACDAVGIAWNHLYGRNYGWVKYKTVEGIWNEDKGSLRLVNAPFRSVLTNHTVLTRFQPLTLTIIGY